MTRRLWIALILIGFAGACSARGGNPLPPGALSSASGTSSADLVADAKSKIKLKPRSLKLSDTGSTRSKSVVVTENGYTGSFKEASSCKGIAKASPTKGHGPKLKVKITGIAAGTCAIVFSDTHKNKARLSITVTGSTTPTPSPSSKPTNTPTPVGNIVCSAPAATVPSNSLSIVTSGNVSGHTYTMDTSSLENFYSVHQYLKATPTPSPSPTPVPTPTPTASPTAKPTPVMITIYYGEYAWTKFTGATLVTSTEYTVPASSGCFTMILTQPPGGGAGQLRVLRPAASSDNALGLGDPKPPATTYQEKSIDFGNLTSATISNLTPTTGNGTFKFKTSGANATSVTGSITITGSETFVLDASNSLLDRWESLVRQAENARLQRKRT